MSRNHDAEFNMTIGRIMERRRLAEGLSRRQVLNLINDQRSTQIVACYELGQKTFRVRAYLGASRTPT